MKWITESNRLKHLVAGTLIYIAMSVVCVAIGVSFAPASVISFVSTAVVAVAVDYKDKAHGGTFDWLDVLATILVPCVITAIIVFVNL